MDKEVFISYKWEDESEETVDQLAQAFQDRDITIIRDKDDLAYKDPIQAFMDRIGRGKCVVAVISNSYLRSKNCMYELVQVAKESKFHDRIFPIVLDDAKIYDAEDRLDYVEHWGEKRDLLDKRMQETGSRVHLEGISDDLNLYDDIRDTIAQLTNILKNMNAFTARTHRKSGFAALIDAVEAKLAE